MTQVVLLSGTSWTVPSDWNNANNKVELIAGGGGGANGWIISPGGGGGYSTSSNLTLSGSITIQVGANGLGGAASSSTPNNGTNGTASFFNGASLSASSVGANPGTGGTTSAGAGGSTTGATGTTQFAGGTASSTGLGGTAAGGGAGAAGPNGAGAAGGAPGAPGGGGGGGGSGGGTAGGTGVSGGVGSAGGTGGKTSGGATSGGTGGTATSGLTNGAAGTAGTEWGSAGSGGGGGGAASDNSTVQGSGGVGGNYGAGGGAGSWKSGGASNAGGNGAPGVIVITYTPSSTIHNLAVHIAESSNALLRKAATTGSRVHASSGTIAQLIKSLEKIEQVTQAFAAALNKLVSRKIILNSSESVAEYKGFRRTAFASSSEAYSLSKMITKVISIFGDYLLSVAITLYRVFVIRLPFAESIILTNNISKASLIVSSESWSARNQIDKIVSIFGTPTYLLVVAALSRSIGTVIAEVLSLRTITSRLRTIRVIQTEIIAATCKGSNFVVASILSSEVASSIKALARSAISITNSQLSALVNQAQKILYTQIIAGEPIGGPITSLHYTANSNWDGPGGSVNPTLLSIGFNLIDVTSAGLLPFLPPGTQALVFLGYTAGNDTTFQSIVAPYIGQPNIWGFYIADEPNPDVVPAANILAEVQYVQSQFPGAPCFIALWNRNGPEAPDYGNYNPTNTGLTYVGVEGYAARDQFTNGFDISIVGKAYNAAITAGWAPSQIVPVYQAFGGGGYGGSDGWNLPTPNQLVQMIQAYSQFISTPAFDYTYAWGSQLGDTSLETTPNLQQVMQQFFSQSNSNVSVLTPIGKIMGVVSTANYAINSIAFRVYNVLVATTQAVALVRNMVRSVSAISSESITAITSSALFHSIIRISNSMRAASTWSINHVASMGVLFAEIVKKMLGSNKESFISSAEASSIHSPRPQRTGIALAEQAGFITNLGKLASASSAEVVSRAINLGHLVSSKTAEAVTILKLRPHPVNIAETEVVSQASKVPHSTTALINSPEAISLAPLFAQHVENVIIHTSEVISALKDLGKNIVVISTEAVSGVTGLVLSVSVVPIFQSSKENITYFPANPFSIALANVADNSIQRSRATASSTPSVYNLIKQAGKALPVNSPEAVGITKLISYPVFIVDGQTLAIVVALVSSVKVASSEIAAHISQQQKEVIVLQPELISRSAQPLKIIQLTSSENIAAVKSGGKPLSTLIAQLITVAELKAHTNIIAGTSLGQTIKAVNSILKLAATNIVSSFSLSRTPNKRPRVSSAESLTVQSGRAVPNNQIVVSDEGISIIKAALKVNGVSGVQAFSLVRQVLKQALATSNEGIATQNTTSFFIPIGSFENASSISGIAKAVAVASIQAVNIIRVLGRLIGVSDVQISRVLPQITISALVAANQDINALSNLNKLAAAITASMISINQRFRQLSVTTSIIVNTVTHLRTVEATVQLTQFVLSLFIRSVAIASQTIQLIKATTFPIVRATLGVTLRFLRRGITLWRTPGNPGD